MEKHTHQESQQVRTDAVEQFAPPGLTVGGLAASDSARANAILRAGGCLADMSPESARALATRIGNSAMLAIGNRPSDEGITHFLYQEAEGTMEANHILTMTPQLCQPMDIAGNGEGTTPFYPGALRESMGASGLMAEGIHESISS